MKSKAGLSLLGYCCYQIQDFANAVTCFEQLAYLDGQQEEYKLYWAQSLYQAGLYSNASKVASQINDPQLKIPVQKLEAAVRFAEEDLLTAQKIINACPTDTDTLVNSGCILYKVITLRLGLSDIEIRSNKTCNRNRVYNCRKVI